MKTEPLVLFRKRLILGIDGFFISKSFTQPSLEDSIDYSGTLSICDIYENAPGFVNNRDVDLCCEVICK